MEQQLPIKISSLKENMSSNYGNYIEEINNLLLEDSKLFEPKKRVEFFSENETLLEYLSEVFQKEGYETETDYNKYIGNKLKISY
jgi:hypothetical protein